MPRQAGRPSEIPYFGPNGCIAWDVDPAEMQSRPAILVRMIRALMDSNDDRDLFSSGPVGRACGERILQAGQFSRDQRDDLGELARHQLAGLRRLIAAAKFDAPSATETIVTKILKLQRRKGAWEFADIMIRTEATVAFCLVDILALVMLTQPYEAVA